MFFEKKNLFAEIYQQQTSNQQQQKNETNSINKHRITSYNRIPR